MVSHHPLETRYSALCARFGKPDTQYSDGDAIGVLWHIITPHGAAEVAKPQNGYPAQEQPVWTVTTDNNPEAVHWLKQELQ